MESKRCYICFSTPIYVLGVPFLILVSEILFFLIFGLLGRNNLIIMAAIPIISHIILTALYRKSETWFKEFIFFLNIPFSAVYKATAVYLPEPPKD